MFIICIKINQIDKDELFFIIHNYNNDSPFYGDALTQVNDIDKKIVDKFLKQNMTEKELTL